MQFHFCAVLSSINGGAGTQHLLLWVIFALVYLAMAFGKLPGLAVDRSGAAVLGAIAMLLVRAIGSHDAKQTLLDAAAAIDGRTILLLFALMLFSSELQLAGFYDVAADRMTHAAAKPRQLLAAVIVGSGALSAVLANDVVCLAMTPVLCTALLAARRNPIPYLVALATASNIGSAATIIGNPQNMFIGSVGHLSFAHYTIVMLPITLAAMGICWWLIVLLWPEDFSGRAISAEQLPATQTEREFQKARGMRALAILGGLIVAFVILPAEWRVIAALSAGGLLLLSRRKESATLYEETDWDLLLLFLGLFVVNGAMQSAGLMQGLFDKLQQTGVDLNEPWTLATVTTGLGNLVSNVPAVLLLKPAITDDRMHWTLLAMASTWAGNLTLVGSIANLIVAEQAMKSNVKLDLRSYCKAGIPLTLATVGIGTAWIIWIIR